METEIIGGHVTHSTKKASQKPVILAILGMIRDATATLK